MVCKCGHTAWAHDYNRDWKVRERCTGREKGLTREVCNCKEFDPR